MSTATGGHGGDGFRKNPQLATFLDYWTRADDLLDHYLQAVAYLRKRGRTAATTGSYKIDLRRLDYWINSRSERAEATVSRGTHGDLAGGGEALDPEEDGFLEAVDMVKQEVEDRVQGLLSSQLGLSWEAIPHLRGMLDLDIDGLRTMFGSISNAWDQLALLKYELTRPDPKPREVDAWLVAIVSEGERFLRDILGLTIATVGRELLADHIERCYEKLGLELEPTVLLREDPTAILGQELMAYMQLGSTETTDVAALLGEVANFDFYPSRPGFEPGFVTVLSWLGESSEDIWRALLRARRDMIHSTDLNISDTSAMTLARAIREREPHELGIIADFVGAFGLRFGFNLLRLILSRFTEGYSDETTVWRKGLVWKLPGELRYLVKRALDESRWPFAWALAEMALDVEPPARAGTMLRLNTFCARKRMEDEFGIPGEFITNAEIARLDVSNMAPRYELLQRSLLRNFDGVEEVLTRAWESRDLSIDEMETWPGLAELRDSAHFRRWRMQSDVPAID